VATGPLLAQAWPSRRSRPVAWCGWVSDGAGRWSGHRGAQTRRLLPRKIGSIIVFAAACTIRSRTVGIESGRRSREPGFGMKTRRAGKQTLAPLLHVRGQLAEQTINAVLLAAARPCRPRCGCGAPARTSSTWNVAPGTDCKGSRST
jgi:hypothetical protein